jgi:hypothetical protein
LRETGRIGETVGVNFDAIAAHPLAGLLALAGGAALLFRSARALLRLGLSAAEGATIDGLVEVSRRNGDLTGMAERQEQAKTIRRARSRSLLLFLLWGGLLAVPPLAGVAKLVYAAASFVWLLPRPPIRPTLVRGDTSTRVEVR